MILPFLHVRPRWLRRVHRDRHLAFAWLPVKVWDGDDFRWVWLEIYERLYTSVTAHCFKRGRGWKY